MILLGTIDDTWKTTRSLNFFIVFHVSCLVSMNWNTKLFFRINAYVGRNRWLDAFGRAGAEWVIIAMGAWYMVALFVDRGVSPSSMILPVSFLVGAWLLGWAINICIGRIVQEPRPHTTHPGSKYLFVPMMSWKSFPSDHAMTAWVIFFLGLLFAIPGVEAVLLMALWVSWGRVFAGVHYPFDIFGGFVVASVTALFSWYLLIVVF